MQWNQGKFTGIRWQMKWFIMKYYRAAESSLIRILQMYFWNCWMKIVWQLMKTVIRIQNLSLRDLSPVLWVRWTDRKKAKDSIFWPDCRWETAAKNLRRSLCSRTMAIWYFWIWIISKRSMIFTDIRQVTGHWSFSVHCLWSMRSIQ